MSARAFLHSTRSFLVFVLLFGFGVSPAFAHRTSDAFVKILWSGLDLNIQVAIAIRDLEPLFAFDTNGDGNVTWGELEAKEPQVAQYVVEHLSVAVSDSSFGDAELQNVSVSRGELMVERHSNGMYLVLPLHSRLERTSRRMRFRYTLLFEDDPQHRGIVSVTDGVHSDLTVASPDRTELDFHLGPSARDLPGPFRVVFREFVGQGIWHIWEGYDHVLFLLSLLLPAVLIRLPSGEWEGARSFRSASWRIFGVVSSFTIAHTLTLALATLGFIHAPSRLVESCIAMTVFVAALNNIVPLIRRETIITFLFGLVHGLGFASVLGDLDLSAQTLIPGLIGFNVGVEIGQLVIVALFLPIAYGTRNTFVYRAAVLRGGSCAVMVLAGTWFIERAFNLTLLGF